VDLDSSINHLGFKPLSYAVSLKMDDIVNYLSLRVKNINDEDPEGFTPLSRYLLAENLEMCSKLLSRGGLDILEYCNRYGRTPLTLALISEKQQAVNWLLIKGVNPHIEDLTGLDSCDYAK